MASALGLKAPLDIFSKAYSPSTRSNALLLFRHLALSESRDSCRRHRYTTPVYAFIDWNNYHLAVGKCVFYPKSVWSPPHCCRLSWVWQISFIFTFFETDKYHVHSGNWTLPNGTLVANVYPNVGGDSGIQDNTGTLHVDTRQTWKLTDGHYVWMHAIGQGIAYVSDDLFM